MEFLNLFDGGKSPTKDCKKESHLKYKNVENLNYCNISVVSQQSTCDTSITLRETSSVRFSTSIESVNNSVEKLLDKISFRFICLPYIDLDRSVYGYKFEHIYRIFDDYYKEHRKLHGIDIICIYTKVDEFGNKLAKYYLSNGELSPNIQGDFEGRFLQILRKFYPNYMSIVVSKRKDSVPLGNYGNGGGRDVIITTTIEDVISKRLHEIVAESKQHPCFVYVPTLTKVHSVNILGFNFTKLKKHKGLKW